MPQTEPVIQSPLQSMPVRQGPPDRGRVSRLVRIAITDYSILILTGVYCLAVLPLVPDLLTPDNLSDVFQNMLPLLIIAIGQTIVLIAGGIDLSLTSVLALASVAGASIMNADRGMLGNSGLAVPTAIGVMLAAGACVGLFNGVAVTVLAMPPFIVTLTTMMAINGAVIWATRSTSIGRLPGSFMAIAGDTTAVLTRVMPITAAVAIGVHLMLSRTLLGQWIFAVGHSPSVSRVSGVPVKRVIVAAYVMSALCAAVASIIYTARSGSGSPTLGSEMLLDVVGATVIGGASLFGGKGKVVWTVFGVMLFALLAKTFDMLGLQPYTVRIIKGLVILLAAALDLLRARIAEGRDV